MHFSILLTLLVSAANLASGQTVSCRRSEEISRCVDAPISGSGAGALCTYRVCGFSYVDAEKCGPNFETRATHMCSRSNVRSTVWKCVPGVEHRRVLLPLGCEGTGCVDEQKACSCREEVVERVIKLPDNLILETCPTTQQLA